MRRWQFYILLAATFAAPLIAEPYLPLAVAPLLVLAIVAWLWGQK